MGFARLFIVDTTLREGEQFVHAHFSTEDKIRIAEALDRFGVEYIELTSPACSPRSFADCQTIARRGLRCKVLTHIRCHREDALRALDAGVDGINLFMGVSPYLQKYSHGKSVTEVIDRACDVLSFIREQHPTIELRFSVEDAFRSRLADVFRVLLAVESLGVVQRLGLADTVGVATPQQVYQVVGTLRRMVDLDIEFHGHNDTGCAVANALAALEAGATHIDTTVLGIGERNGITPLEGLMARLYTLDRDWLCARYNLRMLPTLSAMVAETVGIEVPFSHCVTGPTAFAHKAGVHTKAVLNHPRTYEVLDPEDFGVSRQIYIAHRLTGWHAVRARAEQLGLDLDADQIQEVTAVLKTIGDERPLRLEDLDTLLLQQAHGLPLSVDEASEAGVLVRRRRER